jgi:glycine cleavage system aminomethyltransferase T/glycine/D-amino acid oxidase-like deaminating enzyme
MAEFPSKTRVLIVGGGIVGCSVAYHLTKLGWSDVVLLEQGRLSCGTTWHAAGLVGQLRATQNQTALAKYTRDLYLGLEAETGQATGYRSTGSISVARTPEREEELKRQAGMAAAFGVEVERISLDDAKAQAPLLNTDDLVAAYLIPSDGMTNPTDTTQALARGARNGGAKIVETVQVSEILTDGGRATGAMTDRGRIDAEVVVVCAGMWTRALCAPLGVDVPLHAAEHYYIVTRPLDGVVRNQPVLRDMDGYIYIKEEVGGLLLGGFEPNAKPWGMEGIPKGFEFQALPEDWDQFEVFMNTGLERIPALAGAQIRQLFVGPESFTPDNRYILGEAPALRRLYVAAGFNSIGIQSAGGAGKALAEWIVEDGPTMDLAELDIRRFHRFERNRAYLFDRTKESLGLLYAMHWPFRQADTARGARRSPLHDRLDARGACFGAAMGWERPMWFAEDGQDKTYTYGWGRTSWFGNWAAEHRATREKVALFDMSSFAKFRLEGADAEAVLQDICTCDARIGPGDVRYTQWLNAAGGIEADLTISRLDGDSFLIVTGAAAATRDFTWLKRHIDGRRAVATDVTSGLTSLGLMGPQSRALLQALCGDDVSDNALPYRGSREIEIGYAPVRAVRISYMGELGYELYVATEFAQHLFDRIAEQSAAQGLRMAGYHAMDSLRQEKGFRHWGHDIGIEDTPFQAGLGFAIDWAADFVGRAALEPLRGTPQSRRLVQVLLRDPDAYIYHDEPIFRDGIRVGVTTSASYGHTLGAAVGMGYVEFAEGVSRDWIDAGNWSVEVAGEKVAAAAQLAGFYDPRAERMKG